MVPYSPGLTGIIFHRYSAVCFWNLEDESGTSQTQKRPVKLSQYLRAAA